MERSQIIKNWSLLNNSFTPFKKIINVCALVIFFFSNSYSQTNLVPNGSFETYSSCPPTGNSISYATPWFQPNNPTVDPNGSSDYYNFCSGINCNSLNQCPRTGNGYVGINLFHDSTLAFIDIDREYIEVGLTGNLIIGEKYCIRFFASKFNNSGMSGFPIKQIQAVLTNDSLVYNDPYGGYISGVTPIMEADSIVTDTVNWVPIQTIYTAHGGERFFTIGNFNPGSLTNYLVVGDPNASNNTLGYYLIDDVSIYQQPDVFAGNDTLIPPGDSVRIGITGRPNIFYSWSPTTGLSNPNIANPMATPGVSTTYTLTITDTNQLACTNVFTDTVEVLVGYLGVNENTSSIAFDIYPNPATDQIKIEFADYTTQDILIDVKNMLGQTVYSETIKNVIGKQSKNIDVSALSTGLYFVQIKSNNAISNKKFIKE